MAELLWVALVGYMYNETVARPSTDRAQCTATSSMRSCDQSSYHDCQTAKHYIQPSNWAHSMGP